MEVKMSMAALYCMNIIDGVMTLIGLKLQYITEANQIMNMVYQKNENWLFFVKFGIPSALLLIILTYKELKINKHIVNLLQFALIVYSVLMVYHLGICIQVYGM